VKFKSEYDELREHIKHSLIILLGWLLIIKHLTKATAEHFIAQPDQVISSLYKQSAKLPIHDTLSISVGLLAALFRYVRLLFPLSLFLQVHVSAQICGATSSVSHTAVLLSIGY
jgi:hypothetical protein